MKDLSIDGLVLSSNVIETIVAIAAEDVPGVASIGASVTAGLTRMLQAKPQMPGVEFDVNDDDSLNVGVHIEVYFGMVLPDVAAEVRSVVANAITTQLGVKVGSIDVYIDGLRFE